MASVNKINKNTFIFLFLMHAISISISIFFIFYFFIFIYFLFFGAGRGWTQPAKPVTRRLLPASMRELPMHAGYSYYVIIFLMHTVGELSCKTGDTYLGARWRRWHVVPLFIFF
jgi:hypothetical protein